MFSLPFLQLLVIAALGLYEFTSVRILIDFHGTRFASSLFWRSCSTTRLETSLRIQNRNDVPQALVVLAQEGAQSALKLDLLLKAFVTLHCFQGSELLSQMAFELAEFSEF
jgi:hypothetical protein